MIGLVGYDSSSDEELSAKNALPRQPSLAAQKNTEIPTKTGDEFQNSQLVDSPTNKPDEGPLVGPMLGPAAPANDLSPAEEQSSPAILTEMSERDAIRYLTQAPVPATSLPPSPPGSPNPVANERFKRFLELKKKGVHFNEDLAGKSNFQNPSLLSTMVAKAGITEQEQYNTSLPLDLWNPTDFPEWAFKEGLLKSQQEIHGHTEANKVLLSAAGKRTIEFTSETASGNSSRRSTPGQKAKKKRP